MPDATGPKSLKDEVEELIQRWHPETVSDLMTMLREKRRITATEPALSEVLHELRDEGMLGLEGVSAPYYANFTHFLSDLELNWDFWAILASIIVVNVIVLSPSLVFLAPLRWGLGILAVLLFPGYSVQMCLFPKERELLPWKRILLALGLSIATIGFYAVILDATAQGIVLDSVLIILTLHTLILSWIGLMRRFESQRIRG